MKLWQKIIFISLLVVFAYLRIMPIINHTVSYTYDQGRDFLKIAEMISEKKPTFIGPTTGIMGLFHGSWWYYLLIIPYIFTNGAPLGFYVFMFLISFSVNLGLFFLIKKRFNVNTALLFLSILAISPYFIPMAFTASNNIIVPDLIAALIVLIFIFFDNKKVDIKPVFLIGLVLGFVFEFEVAFGLFIIPVFLMLALIFKDLRDKILNIKKLPFFAAGLIIPFLPRILFEIKNSFLQTKTILNFFIQPKLHNPKPLAIVFTDRITMFWHYLSSIFYTENGLISLLILVTSLSVLFFYSKKYKLNKIITFSISFIASLFAISLVYKDNFWTNYYEGIQYFFLLLVIAAFYIVSLKKTKIATLILAFMLVLNGVVFYKDFSAKNKNQIVGLKETETVINLLYKKVGVNPYCLRIYTPPVIPHTYNYLINYYIRTKKIQYPSVDFVNNQCIYIIENEPYQFRLDKWKEENLPKDGQMLFNKKISNNVSFQIWK